MKPDRFIVATWPQEEWADLPFERKRRKVNRFRQTLSEMFGAVEFGWTIEEGHKNGSPHVNILERGPAKLPQAVLQERWGGIVHVKRIRSAGASKYAMKEAMRVTGYAVKESGTNLDEHLALNGGRLAHWSRGYFDGRRIGDVREALKSDSGSEWEWHPEAVTPSGVLETQDLRGKRLARSLRHGA